MKLEWEQEIAHWIPDGKHGKPVFEWHLKRLIPRPDHPRPYKVSVAWVNREGDRKYVARMAIDQTQTFRSLKQAKAWCLAVYTLEN